MQKVQTRTSARVFRKRDGKAFSGALLFKDGDNSWSGLRDDIAFRVGRFGQLDFTIGGEDYHSQYMPVGMQEIVAPPELMLNSMIYAGVDHAVLQTGWGYGAMNDYNAFAQNQYPRSFTALLNVDEGRAWTNEAAAEFERARSLGLRGVYFALDAFARYGFDERFDSPRFEGFWTRVDAEALPVFIEVAATPDYDLQSYVTNITRLRGLMDRYRDTRWVLVMGPPVGFFGKSGAWQFPDEVLSAYRHDNLLIEIMFPITWGGVWDYPYPEAQELIRGMRDLFGAGKLIWGTDAPNVERFCTYTQCVDYVRRYCAFLSATEKDRILGGNTDDLLKISERIASLDIAAARIPERQS